MEPLQLGSGGIPWGDDDFSRRMLAEHLDQSHDLASRRRSVVDTHVDWLWSMLDPVDEPRVLDLGCGPGLYLTPLVERGATGIGVDIGPASIEYARVNAVPGATYVHSDVRDVAIDERFDLVLFVFGELNTFAPDEVGAVLARIRDWLKPSGLAVLEVSTRHGVEAKGVSRGRYRADGGLFADGAHEVIHDAAWYPAEAATAERWTVGDREYRTTTWWLDPARLGEAGLVVESRFGDLRGRLVDEQDELVVLVARAGSG